MLACGLFFVASLPNALREARGARRSTTRSRAAVAAHLFGYVVVAPLLAYGLAALVHSSARAFGGRGGFLGGARRRCSGSALLAAPLGARRSRSSAWRRRRGPRCCLGSSWLGYAVLAFWLWLFAAGLAEAEGFAATGAVAAVVAAAFAGIAGLLAIAARGGA